MSADKVIFTPTVQRNWENLKQSAETSTCILVQGEIGSGKSLLINELSKVFGQHDDMIHVNVDDSFDSKDLLGKFSATDVPGTFQWVAGPLTTAVQNGHWILMEDIDLASFDVFSVILPLLESAQLFLPDKNSFIAAHPKFKLIATQQLVTSGKALFSRKSNSVPFAELWGNTILETLPSAEVCEILAQIFPSVGKEVCWKLSSLAEVIGSSVSLRTLSQWCQRVSLRLPESQSGDFTSSRAREVMLLEASDCFAARYQPGYEYNKVMALIAEACGVPANVAEPLIAEHKPAEHRTAHYYTIGRVTTPLSSNSVLRSRDSRVAFAPTKQALCLLERLAGAVQSREHVLLTGETGVGKTFIVQYLADQLGQTLVVHNLNQQTDASDFMGGWKPLDVGIRVKALYLDFLDVFTSEFDSSSNVVFLDCLQKAITDRKWERSIRLILKGCDSARAKFNRATAGIHAQNEEEESDKEMSTELGKRSPPRTKNTSSTAEAEHEENSANSNNENEKNSIPPQWASIAQQAKETLELVQQAKTSFSFSYEEGSLVKAWREGHWILLDELNLATTEVLERVAAVLGDVDKLFLTDKGDAAPVPRHPNFHVFANMNPPTDVGKKDLPPSLRSRFTEFYVSDPFNKNDIVVVVSAYIAFLVADARVEEVANFFLDCVENAATKLCSLDGESKPPSFSLRTLTRALTYVRNATPLYGFLTALYDGLLLGFATPLQRRFHDVIEGLIVKNVFRGRKPNPPRLPNKPPAGNYIAYEHIWVPAGASTPVCDEGFILTDSVKGHLVNLARAVFANRPVLLEGPTSSGKSSMIKYLAELTGNSFVRINNHDSTEVQEYLGHYVTDEYGKLRFVDGILVTAVRNGYWVVLDELNLAPTDVLEALNRLLDDNCELFIPDTQETIKPHPQLRIFATQNPAGLYGGRKLLSRAFRNRFLEITVDEIPTSELSYILVRRYSLPQTFADNMVEIMSALQLRRQESQIFAGKHGFITPRDLFRWAERKPQTFLELAEHGFLLLGERCRKEAEHQVVKDVIEKVTKTEIDVSLLYSPQHWPFVQQYYEKIESGVIDSFQIIWTPSMQRLFTIVGICLQHREPVLLVGETGSSKTTVCQLWAALLDLPIHILNCHQHTEAADFLGSLRPAPPDRRNDALFEWHNGPLVDSMLRGDIFVLDEISLTEDSVLERLNSVLEPSRSLTLAEKSSADFIEAHDSFRVLATMNPGGDFGKKELSPALRNRFTEIYVRPVTDKEEVGLILAKRLVPQLVSWAPHMAEILCAVALATAASGIPQHISIRDIIAWVMFMNATHDSCAPADAFVQGLDAIVLEGIGVGTGQSDAANTLLRGICVAEAERVLKSSADSPETVPSLKPPLPPFWEVVNNMEQPRMPEGKEHLFIFDVPATQRNLSKLMRAGVLKKATLLEGSPGVGKTTIVEALGCALGREVVRINLSEQTDIMDLFGTFLPAPDAEAEGPRFAWSDGVLLRAVKGGSWVILDELNLASQSVLEGLNALLDHRSTVFIPELNREFAAHPDFRLFACQNPLIEGGGRKGLPRSFLNRFVKVRVEAFEVPDLLRIARSLSSLDDEVTSRMVYFVGELQSETMVRRTFGHRGSPWEFNLRDVLRWAKLMQAYGGAPAADGAVPDVSAQAAFFAEVLFLQRMRSAEDRASCRALLSRYFSLDTLTPAENEDFYIDDSGVVYLGDRALGRRTAATAAENEEDENATLVDGPQQTPSQVSPVLLMPSQTDTVKALLLCAQQNQFALLVGAAGSGKSYAIRAAAALMNAKLVTFSVTASCDTVDLLGGFDQVEGKQGQFEWKDSLVLEAMEKGYWLVLDNVNYCSASVLDRLNPLVEPNGYLSVNEQGLVNDAIRVVRPHPRFRLFATLNPQFGEISRAMRNRAVELFVAPVAIPSTEALALSAAQRQPPQPQGLPISGSMNSLATVTEFHRNFVEAAFGGADPQQPASSRMGDALSFGAPNVFTLLRAAKMVLDGGAAGEAEEENGAAITTSWLLKALNHCYLQNRGGAWRTRLEEMLQLLEETVRSSAEQSTHAEDLLLRHYPPLADVIEALRFPTGTLVADDVDMSGTQRCALLSRRARRTLLPILAMTARAAFFISPARPLSSSLDFELADVVFRCLLEQAYDGPAAVGLVEPRRRILDAAITRLQPENSSQSDTDTDVRNMLLLLSTTPACVSLSGSSGDRYRQLMCNALSTVGPRRDSLALAAAAAERCNVSDSMAVNAKTQAALAATLHYLRQTHYPSHAQTVIKYTSYFVQHVSTNRISLHSGGFVVSVTYLLLLRTAVNDLLSSSEGDAFVPRPKEEEEERRLLEILASSLVELQDAVIAYVGLSFAGSSAAALGESALSPFIARPHVTTAEERQSLQKWMLAGTVAASQDGRTSTLGKQKLRAFQETAAFRAEFSLLQSLLQLRASSSSSTETSPRAVESVQLQARAFVKQYSDVMRFFAPFETTLWQAVIAVPANHQDALAIFEEFIPVLVSHFVSYFGLDGIRHAFPGSWAAAATACLRYASRVTVSSIGSAGSDHLLALSGFQACCAVLPQTSTTLLPDWASVSRSEVAHMLLHCFPGVAATASLDATTVLGLPAAESTTSEASAPTPLLEANRHLIESIVTLLNCPDGDVLLPIALIWLLKCRLLIPQSPIDPMLALKCNIATCDDETALLDRLQRAFEWSESMMMQRLSTQCLGDLDAFRRREVATREAARRSFSERPDPTGERYASLIRRLHDISGNFFTDDKVSLLSAPTRHHRSSEKRTWSELVYQEVSEVLDQFGGYEDVTMNFSEAAFFATIAVRACCYESSAAQSAETLFTLQDTLSLLQFPTTNSRITNGSSDALAIAPELPLPRGALSRSTVRHHLLYLNACLDVLCGDVAHKIDRNFAEGVFAAFRQVYEFVVRLEEQEQEEERMAVLYKEKTLTIEGDDEKLLRRLKELLPNYEDEFKLPDEDASAGLADGDDDDDQNHINDRKQLERAEAEDEQDAGEQRQMARHARLLLKERDGFFIHRLVRAHAHFYARLASNSSIREAPDCALLLSSYRERFDILTTELHHFGTETVLRHFTAADEQLLCGGFLCRASVLTAQMSKPSHDAGGNAVIAAAAKSAAEKKMVVTKKVEGFNIFRDTDPQELLQFSKPLQALLAAADDLLRQYPDSVCLQRARKIGARLADLPALTTPLMKVMTGSEILLRECYEWERNASHEVSLMKHMTELSSFVLRWRRLELHCWPFIFKSKSDEIELRASNEWFRFHDLLQSYLSVEGDARRRGGENEESGGEEEEKGRSSVVEATFHKCTEFLWSACFGDFGARLQLVRSFGYEALAREGYFSPLAHLCLHIASFFEQFEETVARQRATAVGAIEDDISEFTRIMRWEDANYYAVRATAEKSHLKMARVLGSLDEVLRTPILGVISAEEQRCIDDAALGFPLPASPGVKTAKKKTAATKEGKKQLAGTTGTAKGQKRSRSGKPLERSSPTAPKEDDNAKENASAPALRGIAESHEFFASSADEIVARVHQLQTGKTPQQVKIRSLKMFFDTIAESGIPLAHEGGVDAWSVHFATTEALAACHAVHDDNAAAVALSSAASAGHSRFGRWLQRMRESLRKPHADLSGAQVQRSRSIAEFLFAKESEMTETVGSCSRLIDALRVLHMSLSEEAGEIGEKVADATDLSCDEASAQGLCSASTGGGDSVSGNRVLDATLSTCCELQRFCAEADRLREFSHLSNSDGATLDSLRVATQNLWTLCIRYEPLRRSEGHHHRPLAAAALGSLHTALEATHAATRGLCESGHHILAAAASSRVAPQIAAALRLCQNSRALKAATNQKECTADAAAAAKSVSASVDQLVACATSLRKVMDTATREAATPHPASTDEEERQATEKATAEKTDKHGSSDDDDTATTPAVYSSFMTQLEEAKRALDTMLRQCGCSADSSNDSDSNPANTRAADSASSLTAIPFGILDQATLGTLSGKVSVVVELMEQIRDAMLHALTAHSRFGLVLTRLFTVLISKGFCKPEDQDEEDGDGEGDGQQEQKQGTGMDDGEGEKDVTDEIENEDQLMNMKDKEQQEQDEQKDKKGEEDEDKAADVETDFQAEKENRSEDEEDGDEEDDEESDKEMGSVDGDEAQDRKRQRTEKGDQQELSEDEEGGADAQEVPEDEFNDDNEADEETGGFEDKAEEIRDAEQEEEQTRADKDVIADDEQEPGMDDDDDDDGDSGAEVSDQSGEDREESATDDDLDKDDERSDEEKSDGSASHQDDDASTDDERSLEGEQSIEDDNEEERDDGESGDDGAAKDGLDENVYEGGQEDDEIGQEDTNKTNEQEEKEKPSKQQQQDAAGTEQEQAGDEQEEDDAGRNWKKQDTQEPEKSSKRKDNTERNRSQHNPYKAVKEALQRHNNNIQQLNLNKLADIKDDKNDESEKDKRQENRHDENADDEVDDFQFDEDGEKEGMAATDNNQKPQTKPTSASDEDTDADKDHGDDDEDDEAEEHRFKQEEDAPQETRRKRRREEDQKDMIDGEASKDARPKSKRSKKEISVTAKPESSSEDENDDVKREEEDDDAAAAEADEKMARGRRLWEEQEAAVQGLSQQLCEQLRLILAPTLADKLQGDYKTGKRLNMKRIIPYIASQFKKDRIWLRRTKPNKRTYQIMVALDDSLSMARNNAAVFSCRSVALIAKALQQLEVGEIGIVRFGKEPAVVHPLEEPFIGDSGPRAFSEITFEQKSTNMRLFLERTLDYMDEARERLYGQTRSTTEQLQQVLFIISDGQITEDRPQLRALLGRAEKNHQMVVFILLDIKASDAPGEGNGAATAATTPAAPQPLTTKDLKGLSVAERMRRLKADRESRLKRVQSNSVLDMQLVEFSGGKAVMKLYMEDFPFPFYLVVRDLENLPSIIADAMRQWFEMLNSGL